MISIAMQLGLVPNPYNVRVCLPAAKPVTASRGVHLPKTPEALANTRKAAVERRIQIVALLAECGEMRVSEIHAQWPDVGIKALRTDLRELAKSGQIKRRPCDRAERLMYKYFVRGEAKK